MSTFRVPDLDPSLTRRVLSFELPMRGRDVYAALPTVLRGPRGLIARDAVQTMPEPMLVLYEFESCPFCRRVREVLCELDIPYESRPCAKGSRHRDELRTRGGKVQVPYLIDEAAGTALYESEAIIDHLWRRWAGRSRPLAGRLLHPLETGLAMAGSVARPHGGRTLPGIEERPQPDQVLELWNIEASPYCRRVRETLCALDLPSVVHNIAKRSRHRDAFRARFGRVQVPLLYDPNTDTTLIESRDIIDYLVTTYGPRPAR